MRCARERAESGEDGGRAARTPIKGDGWGGRNGVYAVYVFLG